MKRPSRLWLVILCLVVATLVGCRRPPVVQPTATSDQPANQAKSAPGGSPVLEACDTDAQAAAMLSGHLPDWRALGLAVCYDLSLKITADQETYTGQAQLTYTHLHDDPLPDLVFRTYPNSGMIYGGELSITHASVDGKVVKPQVFLSDSTAVRLPLANPLMPGDSTEIELAFSGLVPVDFGDSSGLYGIFNYVTDQQVLTLANWYPLLSVWRDGAWQAEPITPPGDAVVSEVALYKVAVEAPSNWKVVTTGSLVGERSLGEDVLWEFVSGPVREFIVISSPNFVEERAQADSVNIHHWGLPAGQDFWQEALQATVNSMSTFNKQFGPYPFAELDVVAVPLENALGVEYPGLFIVGDTVYESVSQEPWLMGIIVSHEAAHQWWYSLVGSDVIQHPWQDEALATYSSLLYQEDHEPQYYQGTLQFYQERVASVEDQPGDTAIDQPVLAFTDRMGVYSPVVYQKGALFYVALREKLGDEDFFGAIQEYYASNTYQLVTPEPLLGVFEQQCNCELDDFYAEWGVTD